MTSVIIRYPVEELTGDLAGSREQDRLRLVFEFVDRWREADDLQCAGLVAGPPLPTNSRQWDSLVAGLVEYLAAQRAIPTPTWVDEPHRFVDGAWWVIDTPLFRVWALHDTPAALLRHGVMLSRADLERV